VEREGLPITTVSEFGLGMQAWVGMGEPDPAKARPTGWEEDPRGKPPGFFTSSWNALDRSTAWLDHLQVNQRASPSETRRVEDGTRVWLLDPNPDARLYIIDTAQDDRRLSDAYPHRYANVQNTTVAPHWRQIAEAEPPPFDAVHITSQGAVEEPSWSADGHPPWLRWEVESTWWMRWRLKPRACVGTVAPDWTLTQSPS